MALIKMELYDDLEKTIQHAHETNTVYNVNLKAIKKDLNKRKAGRVARIVILTIWAVILLGAVLIASGLLEFGGSASVEGSTPPENVGSGREDSLITWAMLPMLFVPATWTLCFVGFPIGWNWSKDDREQAKTQLYVQYTVDEDGYVDTFASTAPARVGAFFFSLIQGCLTMIASIPLAIVQVFTWKKHIKRIQNIVAQVEGNPDLFVAA